MIEFTNLADLAAERLGGRVLEASDDFFAPKENLLKEAKPVFIEEKYTPRGKWMDGWESRRRRTPGHDWCIVRLGLPGTIRGVVVDTSFFTGNFPECFSLEGCDLGERHPYKNEKQRLHSTEIVWTPILPETQLKGDSRNLFMTNKDGRFTHLRLRIYPDGGVARLRVHGEAVPDPKSIGRGEIDLVAVENGGSALASSDQHYGAPCNLLMPYRGKNMGDGWETRRRRGPGDDWVVLKLGVRGAIHRVMVDTAHFKGNYPDSCSLEALDMPGAEVNAATMQSLDWQEVLPKTKLKANHRHVFERIPNPQAATHVRFRIYPDGGVSRLRIFGQPEPAPNPAEALTRLNLMSRSQFRRLMLDCCGSRRWAEHLTAGRPYPNEAALYEHADRAWSELGQKDWLEAFQHHPPIGGQRTSAKQASKASRWSAKEQSTALTAAPEVLSALARENRAYAKNFGFVFLICATAKTSEEILQALRQRMPNDPATELRIAAEEQRKIMRLRLEKVLSS